MYAVVQVPGRQELPCLHTKWVCHATSRTFHVAHTSFGMKLAIGQPYLQRKDFLSNEADGLL